MWRTTGDNQIGEGRDRRERGKNVDTNIKKYTRKEGRGAGERGR